MSLLDTFNSVQVMSEFESSPLLPFILKPELETYKLPDFAKSTILLPRSSSAQVPETKLHFTDYFFNSFSYV